MITLTRLAAAQYKGLVDISLTFPERGSFLIEGRNEAGKSTLFDAVHFALYGRPLVGDQADAIHYGADQAGVELGLAIDGTQLAVKRTLRQTAKTLRAEAELEVIRGEDVELVRGAAAVNQRLQQELGGLTAEALLNSCLVAQKQLARIETLDRAAREQALTVLLNLNKLTDVHNRLRVRPDDEEQLRRGRARVALARVAKELARLDETYARLDRARRLVVLRAVLDQLAHLRVTREESSREREAQLTQLETLRVALAEVDALRGELTRAEELDREARAIEQRRAERAELGVRRSRIGAELDQLRKQHRDVQGALQQLAPLTAALETSRARQRQLGGLQRQVATALDRRAAAAALAQRAERVSELLARWLEVRRQEEVAEQAKRLMDDLALGVAGVEVVAGGRRKAAAGSGLRLRLLVDHPLTGGLALQLRLWPGGGELLDVRPVTAKEAERLSSSGLPTLSASGLEETQRERAGVAAQLAELGEAEPRDIADAERRLMLPGEVDGRERASRDAAALEARCIADAVALHVPLGEERLDLLPSAVADELQREAQRQAELSVGAGRREGLQGQLAILERNGRDRRRELDECESGLAQDSDEALVSRSAEVARARARVDVERIRQRLEQLGEASLGLAEQNALRAAGAAEATLERCDRDEARLATQAAALAAALGHPGLEAQDGLPERIEQAIPEVTEELPPEAEFVRSMSALDQQRGSLEREAADARALLGADEAVLPLDEAEAELGALQDELAARRRGQEIVASTRQRMIGKVLPDTIDNMCLLLPMLTAERYRYAQLTADYRLQVWDERKRAFVEKNLFSGGTQDQFSLALRLGFALAALPRELGTSPGFLFLDEPLSSFDRDRTEALVALLTRGQIATFFRQVFLISHSQGFDPALFSHHIVMEHGRIAESTLPSGASSGGQR